MQDLAHALSNRCRFGGHNSRFYSTAEHALLIASFVAAGHPAHPDVIEAALHDADHKAYVGDTPSPVRELVARMSLAPRVAREGGAYGLLRLGLHVHHPLVVRERTAQDGEPAVHEGVHERRVLDPAGLLLQRARLAPTAARTAGARPRNVGMRRFYRTGRPGGAPS